MNPSSSPNDARSAGLDRRDLLAATAAFGSAFLARQGLLPGAEAAREPQAVRTKPSGRVYPMKKSINLWAFPYPDKWSLRECLELARDAGFDGVELNLALEGEFSAESPDEEIRQIRRLAEQVGIAVSGVCSFLFWPYPLTHPDPQQQAKAMELARKMIRAAELLGTENLLIVPGAVTASWVEDFEPVPIDVCLRRARQAVAQLLPEAKRAGVLLNIENIFVNGFLFSPQEMIDFVDGFKSDLVRVHFDTGNILQYQFPEDWIRLLGRRIQNVHFKEWDGRTHEFNLHCFRTLLDGTTNWPAVIEALHKNDYRGYLTFEYFHPFNHYPEALIYQTSDALDWMLGRKG